MFLRVVLVLGEIILEGLYQNCWWLLCRRLMQHSLYFDVFMNGGGNADCCGE